MDSGFLCFRVKRWYLLVPLENVYRVVSQSISGEHSPFGIEALPQLPVIHMETASDACVLVVQDGSGLLGLAIDDIEGMIEISPENQFDIPELAKEKDNRFLEGISYWPEKKKLCYLLNIGKFRGWWQERREVGQDAVSESEGGSQAVSAAHGGCARNFG